MRQSTDSAEIQEETNSQGSDEIDYHDLPADEELTSRIDARIQNAGDYYQRLIKRHREGKEYWKGKQTDEMDLYEGEDPVNVNRVFYGIETIIPIAVKRIPEPNVTARPIEQSTRRLAAKLTTELKDLWRIHNKMPYWIQRSLRNQFTAGYFTYKYWYCEESGRFKAKHIPIGRIVFPKGYASEEDLPWIAEYVDTTIKELKSKFPDKEAEIDKIVGMESGIKSEDDEITYLEYWESDFYVCKYKNVVLAKDKNPNFNFEEDEQTKGKNKKLKRQKYSQNENKQVLFNYFTKPRVPYLFHNYLNFGEDLADETTLVEEVKTLQDSVNKRKRQFELNGDMANGLLVVAGNRISKKNADQIEFTPGEALYLKGAETATGAVDIVKTNPVSQGLFQDMQHSESEIDNVMGTHATTRGERTAQETATGRQILKSSDEGRIELLTKNIEAFAEKFYQAAMQIMYAFYDEQHPIHSIEDETNDIYELSEIEKNHYILNKEFEGKSITVLVEEGSTVPKDKSIIQAQAIDLAMQKMMSLKDMYKELGYPNPMQYARNAIIEQIDPMRLYSELSEAEQYDIEAIEHIRQILEGELLQEEDGSQTTFDSQDIDMYSRHVGTHTAYMQGRNVDEDIPPYDSLDNETKAIIQEHVQFENMKLQDLIAQQQQELAMQGGIDPAMAVDPNAQPPQAAEGQTQPPQTTEGAMPIGNPAAPPI